MVYICGVGGSYGGIVAALIIAAGAIYVGCGAVYGRRRRGSARRGGSHVLASHPHWHLWVELAGLVTDGVRFVSRQGGRSTDRAGYRSLPPPPPASSVDMHAGQKKGRRARKSARDSKAATKRRSGTRRGRTGEGQSPRQPGVTQGGGAAAAESPTGSGCQEPDSEAGRQVEVEERRDHTVHSSMAKVTVVKL
eukprot:SAG25_NODE_436_length_8050_cov_15.278581_9_plen_193_part_00